VQTAEVGEVQHQPGSGPIQRRVVFKAAALAEGPNTRFVATTRTERPLVVYARYIDRGEPENWIKELKNALQADRLSDRRFWANAFSLVLHAAAYWTPSVGGCGPPIPKPRACTSSRSAAGCARSPIAMVPSSACTSARIIPARGFWRLLASSARLYAWIP